VREETTRDSIYRRLALYSALQSHLLSKKKEKLTKEEKAGIKKYEDYQKKVSKYTKKKISEASDELTRILKEKPKKSGITITVAYVMLAEIGLAILLLIYADYLI